jgi:hypothetical protein
VLINKFNQLTVTLQHPAEQGTSQLEVMASESVTDGDWHVIVGSISSNGLTRLFVDGQVVASAQGPRRTELLECTNILLHSAPAEMSGLSIHITDISQKFAISHMATILLHYDELATKRLWLFNEGEGIDLSHCDKQGTLMHSTILRGEPQWNRFQPSEVVHTSVYLQPGEEKCLPLLHSAMNTSDVTITVTSIPDSGLLFQTNSDCSAWLSQVEAGSELIMPVLIYIAPWHPTESALGTLEYVAHSGQVSSNSAAYTIHVEEDIGVCGCDFQACHPLHYELGSAVAICSCTHADSVVWHFPGSLVQSFV